MTLGKGKHPATPKRDFMQVAREIVEQSIGEKMDGSSLPEHKESARAIAGRSGGIKGGKARAAKLTEAERKNIAKKAALKRWGTPKPNPTHSLK
jgi:hypothetical protein